MRYLLSFGLFLVILAMAQPAQAAWSGNLFHPLWWLGSAEPPAPKIVPEPRFLPKLNQRIIESVAAAQTSRIVAGWLTPWGDDSFNSFKDNLDTLTEIHPFAYSLAGDGISLEEDTGDWHKTEVLHLAKTHGILVIPTIHADNIENSDLMLNDPAKRTAHIATIVQEIEDHSYDGFNVDYEGFLNGYNRDVYVAFMQELGQALHARGKILAMSIEAFNRQQDWQALGKIVDRFMIMGYDYHPARGPEVGPIGPASWLKEVVDYAASQVPRQKIVLGLGTYGYAWIDNGNQYVSEAVGYQDALDIAAEMGATIDRQDDAPFFTYDRGEGLRSLYFEDAQSTAPKLDLAKDQQIGGIAFWRLGTEDPGIWLKVKQYRD